MPDDDLIFMMGQYEARLPVDRHYAEGHVWFQKTGELYRVGFTAYAVRLLQDVYFLDWAIDPETAIRKKQTIGEIESSKAVSNIYAPADGFLQQFNPAILNDPSLINTDPYGMGWIYEMATEAPLLTVAQYRAHLEANWELTQRTLKGQYNESAD